MSTCCGFKKPNNAFIDRNSKCVTVVSAVGDQFLCRVYKIPEPPFAYPCDSRNLGISRFLVKNSVMKYLPRSALQAKALMIEKLPYVLVLPILHDRWAE